MNADPLTILGAGPAGLAVGYYSAKASLPFAILEAGQRVGGNAVTLRHGDFRFDSGAHRLHDKDPGVTRELKGLLGQNLLLVDAPSHIYHRGTFIDFPLSPMNLLFKLGVRDAAKASSSLLMARLQKDNGQRNFEQLCVENYGRVLAERLLFNYSAKLWGLPAHRLSVGASGNRLSGLDLRTFLKEALLGTKAKTRHLDGSFYYPRRGFGAITSALAAGCGDDRIRLRARITKILHDGERVQAVEVNGHERIEVRQVVNTLPISAIPGLLDPSPCTRILQVARSLCFRSLIIVVLFIDRPRVTGSATIYFPDEEYSFTRIYEPKNRCREMSPPHQTSLCAEIPCAIGDSIWKSDDGELSSTLTRSLEHLGWTLGDDVFDTKVFRLPFAYPVLEVGVETKVAEIASYLGRFRNLRMVGRNAGFLHASVHDMLRLGMETVTEYRADSGV